MSIRYTVSASEMTASHKPAVRMVALCLFVVCAGLLVVGSSHNPRLAPVRHALMDASASVLALFSQPAQSWQDTKTWWHDITHLYADNKRLSRENDALKHWQSVARALEAENAELKRIAGYMPVESTAYITARMVGHGKTVAGHMALLNVGFEDGVRNHQAVVSADGLIGRISDVAARSSRVLLLSDVNARVPVMGVQSREKAMLTGMGEGLPALQFVAQSSGLVVGEALVTTEDGGVIPAGIAVGQVFSRVGGEVRVQLTADAARATYLRVVSHDTPLSKAPTLMAP